MTRAIGNLKAKLLLATIDIITHMGQRMVLQVLVVEDIATHLQIPLSQHIHEMSHLKDLTLAHAITPHSISVCWS